MTAWAGRPRGIFGQEFHDEVTGADGTIAFFNLDGGLLHGLYERANLAKDAGLPPSLPQLRRVQPGRPRWITGRGRRAAPAGRSRRRHALRKLPNRQREAIVLQYYADLSEAEFAAAMGISRGAVKAHTARGMAALRPAME